MSDTPQISNASTNETTSELLARIAQLEDRLNAVVPPTGQAAHIWFLLDRSGSMASIADDVVGGFDQFFADQRAVAGAADVTFVQFDSDNPHDVIVDAQPLRRVQSIRGQFAPRGSTPLYDAIERLLDRAEARRGAAADQLVVIYTDGHENASRHITAAQVFDRIARLRAAGWTFVFLGANQDSYAAGAKLSMSAGNTANFAAAPASVRASAAGLSRTVSAWRKKDHAGRLADIDDFWGGVKESEAQVR